MSIYITIDGGTTNTRVSLVVDYALKDILKISRGARSGIDDKDGLKAAIKEGIDEILSRNNITESDICRILASGMITSEFGLCPLPHTTVPAGIEELHNTMHEVVMEEISTLPIVFVRGVKTDCESLESADMMRGEETELMGILDGDAEECVYVLPGSHSKIIHTDGGRITDFATMLTGEMIASLSQNTILKDAVDLSCTDVDEEYLLKGYFCCENKGINEALFKTRILKNIFGCNREQTYSFFLGVVLQGEIDSLVKCGGEKIVLGGKSQIKNAMNVILKNVTEKKVVCLSDDAVDNSTSMGLIKIYEYNHRH